VSLERLFHVRARGSSVPREVVGGLTTFVTMSYVVFVHPAVLAMAGMDAGAVMAATCLAAAFATALMGVWANYPIAVAPAMGHNFYFALVVCGPAAAGGLGVPWPVALGANFIAGCAFLVLTLTGLRELLLDAIPEALKQAIAVGIGLLIALVGFEWGGLVRDAPGTLVRLGDLHEPAVVIAAAGTLLTAALVAQGFRGAILAGTLATAVAAVVSGLLPYRGLVAAPPSLAPTFARLDVAGALRPDLLPVIAVLFFLGLFDTIGTLVGIAGEGGLLAGGRLARAREAMGTDAIGTMAGTVLGTSTVTAYVESAAGVAAGARTGLASLVTAACLLASLVLSPLARLAGQGIPVHGATLYPVVAPALIVVGSFMVRGVSRIDFADAPGGIAAFLTIVVMPFTFSITEGIAAGSIAYALLMLAAGRARAVHPLLWLCAAAFVVRYVWL
jgi:AGZA family xanthine/uracil permease-like MFS transporter